MLVLSRRPEEKILLPTVPAIIKVISSQTGLVRLGIEAPSHVPILREELTRKEHAGPGSSPTPPSREASAEHSADQTPSLRHLLRNRLNNLTLGLTLLRVQLAQSEPVGRTLDGLEVELQALRHHVASGDIAETVENPTLVGS